MARSQAQTRPARRARRPSRRRSVARRWIAVAVLGAIAFAYVHPVRSYLDAREKVARQRAEIAALDREQRGLESKVEVAETPAFVEREARKLGFVRPGERLFIVTPRGR